MANKLADARQSPPRAQESTLRRLEELEGERREIKASLKSLAAALKALEKSKRKHATDQTARDDEPCDEAPIDPRRHSRRGSAPSPHSRDESAQ